MDKPLVAILSSDNHLDGFRFLQQQLDITFETIVFSDSNEFFESIAQSNHDLIILESLANSADNISICKNIRDHERNIFTPIIVIAETYAQKDLSSFIAAEVDEFIVKPFDADILMAKIEKLLKHNNERQTLSQQSQEYLDAAMEAMTGSSELGIIILFLQNSYACHDYESLSRALFEALTNYNLTASLMIEGQSSNYFMSSDGELRDLDNKILESCKDKGRILDFNRRSIYNGNQCSFIIRNMPIEDEAKAGRLRDHLATILVGMDARLKGIDIEQGLIGKQNTIREVVHDTKATLAEIDRRNKQQRIEHASVLNDLGKNIEGAYLNLGLTQEQEDFLSENIQHAEQISDALFDNAADIDGQFESIIKKLLNEIDLKSELEKTAQTNPDCKLADATLKDNPDSAITFF